MTLFRFIWALLVVPAWLLLASLVPQAVPKAWTWPAFGAGIVLSTLLVWLIDRRYGAPGAWARLLPDGSGAMGARLLPFALLAGAGFAIIGSEIGNIGLSIAGPPTALGGGGLEESLVPAAHPWVAGLVWSLLYPACLVYVVHGVVQKSLYHPIRPWSGVIVASLLGSVHAPPAAVVQWMFILALPGWIVLRSRSLLLGIAAFLPGSSLPLLEAFGWTPGIQGFDVTAPDQVLWQPIWFDLLGAVLIAAGCGPLIASFQGPVLAEPEPEEEET